MEKRRSQFALDCLSFFLSDVETGVGPFMAGYFTAVRHWNPAQIGIILAAQKLASVLAQASAGWFIDRTTHKTLLMSAAALIISFGAAFVVWSPSVGTQVLNQIAVGVSTAMATLLLAALSLGIVGRQALGSRIGRNGAFSHAGNMLTAAIAGYLGYRIGQQWIFYISSLLGLACAASALAIRSADIDDAVAREAPEGTKQSAFSELLRSPHCPRLCSRRRPLSPHKFSSAPAGWRRNFAHARQFFFALPHRLHRLSATGDDSCLAS